MESESLYPPIKTIAFVLVLGLLICVSLPPREIQPFLEPKESQSYVFIFAKLTSITELRSLKLSIVLDLTLVSMDLKVSGAISILSEMIRFQLLSTFSSIHLILSAPETNVPEVPLEILLALSPLITAP